MDKSQINQIERSLTANSLALHDFAKSNPDLKVWVGYVVDLFRQYGLEPTRMGISSPSVKSTKMNSFKREIKKLGALDDKAITGITLQATLNGSDDSQNDDIFTAIFDVGQQQDITTFTLVLDKEIVPYNVDTWTKITRDFSLFFKPRYGYLFQRDYKKGPEWYPFGTSCNLKWDDPEISAINCWSLAYRRKNGQYRSGDMRDIYPLNVLSEAHNERIVEEKSLFDWINEEPSRGKLTLLANNLWVWWVEEKNVRWRGAPLGGLPG